MPYNSSLLDYELAQLIPNGTLFHDFRITAGADALTVSIEMLTVVQASGGELVDYRARSDIAIKGHAIRLKGLNVRAAAALLAELRSLNSIENVMLERVMVSNNEPNALSE